MDACSPGEWCVAVKKNTNNAAALVWRARGEVLFPRLWLSCLLQLLCSHRGPLVFCGTDLPEGRYSTLTPCHTFSRRACLRSLYKTVRQRVECKRTRIRFGSPGDAYAVDKNAGLAARGARRASIHGFSNCCLLQRRCRPAFPPPAIRSDVTSLMVSCALRHNDLVERESARQDKTVLSISCINAHVRIYAANMRIPLRSRAG